jgi:hypothetical protein
LLWIGTWAKMCLAPTWTLDCEFWALIYSGILNLWNSGISASAIFWSRLFLTLRLQEFQLTCRKSLLKYQRSKVLFYSSVSKLSRRKISRLFKLSNKHQFLGHKKHNRPQLCHRYLLMSHRTYDHDYARYGALGKLFRSARLLLVMPSILPWESGSDERSQRGESNGTKTNQFHRAVCPEIGIF